jgi:hypothetical protein
LERIKKWIIIQRRPDWKKPKIGFYLNKAPLLEKPKNPIFPQCGCGAPTGKNQKTQFN